MVGNFRTVQVTYPVQNFTQLVSKEAQSGPVFLYNTDSANTVYLTDATVGTVSTVDSIPLPPLSGYGVDGNTDTYAFMMTPGQTANVTLMPGGQTFFQPSIVNGSTLLDTNQLLYDKLTGPAANKLVASFTESAGIDAFGNNFLAGESYYNGPFAYQLFALGLTGYIGSLAAGWSQVAQISFNPSGQTSIGPIARVNIGNAEVIIPPTGDITGVKDSAAIAQVQSIGAVPRLTGGLFFISTPVAVGAGGVLAGSGTSTAQVTDAGYGGPSTVIQAGTSFAGAQMISVQSGAVIRGFRLDGSALPAGTDGISGSGACYDVRIEDVDIYNVTNNGVNVIFSGTNPFSWKLHSVNVSAAHNIGFNLPNMTDLIAVDCKAISCGNNEGWYLNGCGNSTLIGCQAEECGGNGGFYLNGNSSGLTMVGCSTQNNIKSGIYIDASTGNLPITLSGCRGNGDGTNLAAGRAGIEVSGSAGCIIQIDGYACFPTTTSPDKGVNMFGTPALVNATNIFAHGITGGWTNNTTGGIVSTRGVYQRAGSIASPGAIALVADSA